jgi:hypothetical protein
MSMKRLDVVCGTAILIATFGGGPAWTQEGGKAKDDALESLLKELNEPEKAAKKPDGAAKPEAKQGDAARKAAQPKSGSGSATDKSGKASDGKTAKPSAAGSPEAGKVSAKDQALDELLGKLGEIKDEPTDDEHPQNGGQGADRGQPPAGGGKPGADKLGAKDKDLDERLEELTGRKKKRSSSNEERTGPIGEMIKEMRDVEKRLGKPDPSEDTQKKQKQIVKRIETLIEQAKQSGSGAGRMVIRRVRQPGQQPGQQPGDQPGAMARGAPPMKPAKPTGQHSTAGGKDVWGHLPDELRAIMENSFKETELDSKRELISQYFLSVGKGKVKREE